MRIDMDPLALRLRQQHLQILEIVTRHDDERSLFHVDLDLVRRRIAIDPVSYTHLTLLLDVCTG